MISQISVSDINFMFYSSGIYTGPCSGHPEHAVLVVGYERHIVELCCKALIWRTGTALRRASHSGRSGTAGAEPGVKKVMYVWGGVLLPPIPRVRAVSL